MNRRKFIKNAISGLFLTAAAPSLFLPKLVKPKWKVAKIEVFSKINPEWVDAPYEAAFFYSIDNPIRPIIFEKLLSSPPKKFGETIVFKETPGSLRMDKEGNILLPIKEYSV